jgi:hypothetical protein
MKEDISVCILNFSKDFTVFVIQPNLQAESQGIILSSTGEESRGSSEKFSFETWSARVEMVALEFSV